MIILNKQGITISLCMIVRDEEKTIARCLDGIEEIVDEIVVVDTGSVDRTKEIVEKYTLIYMISSGLMIFRRLEILLFQKRRNSIYYG